jgi:hypothetical protein
MPGLLTINGFEPLHPIGNQATLLAVLQPLNFSLIALNMLIGILQLLPHMSL